MLYPASRSLVMIVLAEQGDMAMRDGHTNRVCPSCGAVGTVERVPDAITAGPSPSSRSPGPERALRAAGRPVPRPAGRSLTRQNHLTQQKHRSQRVNDRVSPRRRTWGRG